MSMKVKDRRSARNNYDPSSVDSNSYNDAAGGRKITDVGHHLKPIKLSPTSYTTDASSIRKIGKGISIAVFSTVAGTITIGDASDVAVLATGVTSAGGYVGVPIAVNQWIYLNTYTYNSIIASSSDIKVFIIEDDTYIDNTPA